MKAKKATLVIFLFVTMLLSSQIVKAQLPTDPETGKVLFTGVVDLPNQTKETIHKKAKLWITSTLKSGDNMTELNDENSNQVVGTGNLLLDSLPLYNKYYSKSAILNFKFIVFCKDNKLKYSVENFLLHYSMGLYNSAEIIETGLEDIKGSRLNMSKKNVEEFKKTTPVYLKKKIEMLIADFVSYMKKVEDNNW